MKPQVPEGMRVWYEHHRRLAEPTRMDQPAAISPRGGRTVARLFAEGQDPQKDVPVAMGEANCSANDNYSKRTGRMIALGRAIEQYRSLAG